MLRKTSTDIKHYHPQNIPNIFLMKSTQHWLCPIFRHWESVPTSPHSDPNVVSEDNSDFYTGQGHSNNYKENKTKQWQPKGNCYREVTLILPKSQNWKVDRELRKYSRAPNVQTPPSRLLWRRESLTTLGSLVKALHLCFNHLCFSYATVLWPAYC